jgi:hypothetical protein
MQTRRLTIYGAIALATPLLVLTNVVLSAAELTRRQTVNPLPALFSNPTSLATPVQQLGMAYRAWMMHPQARLMVEENQPYLDFYAPFNSPEQGPELTLVLVANPLPVATIEQLSGVRRDRTAGLLGDRPLSLGKMQPTAGQHRYAIPAVADIGRYQAVIIWSADLEMVMGYAPLET